MTRILCPEAPAPVSFLILAVSSDRDQSSFPLPSLMADNMALTSASPMAISDKVRSALVFFSAFSVFAE